MDVPCAWAVTKSLELMGSSSQKVGVLVVCPATTAPVLERVGVPCLMMLMGVFRRFRLSLAISHPHTAIFANQASVGWVVVHLFNLLARAVVV